MIYAELFWVFAKIGLFAFGGGLAMISIIQQEVVGHGWLSIAEYARIVTISQMTPGPVAINMATYVGARICCPDFWPALLGSIVATFSVSLPSFILISLVARSMKRFSSSPIVVGILSGLRPSVIAMMMTAVVFFVGITFFPGYSGGGIEQLFSSVRPLYVLLTAVLFYLHYYRGLGAITLIVVAGIVGVLM